MAVQAAPSFSNSFPQIFGGKSDIPCLIPCAIDQDAYFRQTRKVAAKLKYPRPCLMYTKFLPSLQGADSKMSASNKKTAIYLDDTPSQIKNKINKFAFSGGGDTIELHREKGGNPDVDVPYQYLKFFIDDDAEIKRLGDVSPRTKAIAPADLSSQEYRAGTLSTSEMKARCIDELQVFVGKFQEVSLV